MKLSALTETAPRNTQTMSDDDWEECVEQLRLLLDIVNSKSKKRYTIEENAMMTTPAFDLITVDDARGYPSLTINRSVTGPIGEHKNHYFIYRSDTEDLPAFTMSYRTEKEAVAVFLKFLKEAP